jgi:MFS family permease
LWGAAGSGGLAAGALLGGVLTGAWGWRSALFAMVPLTVVGLGAAPRLLTADGPRRGRVAGFDLPGTLAATSGSALLVFGLVSGPQYGWSSPRSILALAAGVMLLAAFLLIERRSGDPVVPLRMLRRRSLLTAMAVILVFQSTLGGTYYLFTIYLQDGRGYTPLDAGLAFLPLTIVSMAASLKLTPALIGRWGLHPTLTVGMIVNGLGVAALAAAMSAGGSFWAVLPGLLIWGVGGGVTFPAMFVSAAAGVEPGEQGIASAMAVTAQQIGGALGLAAFIAVAATSSAATGPTDSVLIDGLRAAGWTAGAVSVAGALLIPVLRKGRTAAASRTANMTEPHDRPQEEITP